MEQFRTKAPRQRIHGTEKVLLYVVAAQLVFLPWALGGMRVWAQWISLGLSMLAFGVSLIPRNYQEVGPGQAPFRLYTWPKPTSASSKATRSGSRPSPCTTPADGALATAEEGFGEFATD